jgi:hypothetical protein
MLPFVYLLTVLSCGAIGYPARNAASLIPKPEQQQQDPKPSPTEQTPSDTPSSNRRSRSEQRRIFLRHEHFPSARESRSTATELSTPDSAGKNS